MCDHKDKRFGAPYIDAECRNGWMLDIDAMGPDYAPEPDPDASEACPACNTLVALDQERRKVLHLYSGVVGHIALWERVVYFYNQKFGHLALDALARMPRHVFIDTDGLPPNTREVDRRTWPWPMPFLTAHENHVLMQARHNPPGDAPETASGAFVSV